VPETTSAAADAAVRAALAQVRDMRANFEDAVRRAGAAGTTTALDVQKVLSDFDALEAEVESASEDEIETLTDKAERLERLRAYVYPPAEVQFEGKTAFADLRQLLRSQRCSVSAKEPSPLLKRRYSNHRRHRRQLSR